MSHVEEMPTLSSKRNGWAIKESNMEPIHTRSEKKTGGEWFTLRNAIMDDPAYLQLTLRETRLLHGLLRHADGDGRCWPSSPTLARYVVPNFKGGYAPTDLFIAMKSLERKGFVSKESGGRGRSNRYTLLVPSADDHTHGESNRVTHGESTRGTHVPRTRGTHGESTRANSHSTDNVTPTRTRRVESTPSDGVSKGRNEKIIKAFRDLGVRKPSLVRTTLRERGRSWMKNLLAESKRGKASPCGFAVWALQHPGEVNFNRSGHADDDPGLRRRSFGLCEQCGKEPAVDGCWCQPCIDRTLAENGHDGPTRRKRRRAKLKPERLVELDNDNCDELERCGARGCTGIIRDDLCSKCGGRRLWDFDGELR